MWLQEAPTDVAALDCVPCTIGTINGKKICSHVPFPPNLIYLLSLKYFFLLKDLIQAVSPHILPQNRFNFLIKLG